MSKRKRKRGPSNSHRFREGKNRRRQRCSERGREFEKTFSMLLEKMQKRDMIVLFKQHPPNSPEDRSGKDFTVWKMVNGKCIGHSFGITTSSNSLKRSRVRYPTVPQFHFPMETRPETMQKRVLGLFED